MTVATTLGKRWGPAARWQRRSPRPAHLEWEVKMILLFGQRPRVAGVSVCCGASMKAAGFPKRVLCGACGRPSDSVPAGNEGAPDWWDNPGRDGVTPE